MRIGLGGGCHWCTEAVFQALCGVERVEQGFIRSTPPCDAWSEAVIVHFDPGRIGLDTLIEVHARTHSATREHAMRDKYRSAVYAFDETQTREATAILAGLQNDFEHRLIVRVLPFVDFVASEARYRNYYQKHREGAFCQRYIDPKLALIQQQFAPYSVDG